MRWHPHVSLRQRYALVHAHVSHRPPRALAPDEAIPPTPGLSAAYLCQTAGCVAGTCDYCRWLRGWGARSVCCGCGAPLEQPPDVFIGQRPLCGECA